MKDIRNNYYHYDIQIISFRLDLPNKRTKYKTISIRVYSLNNSEWSYDISTLSKFHEDSDDIITLLFSHFVQSDKYTDVYYAPDDIRRISSINIEKAFGKLATKLRGTSPLLVGRAYVS